MKYLKKFKLFENNQDELQRILKVVKDSYFGAGDKNEEEVKDYISEIEKGEDVSSNLIGVKVFLRGFMKRKILDKTIDKYEGIEDLVNTDLPRLIKKFNKGEHMVDFVDSNKIHSGYNVIVVDGNEYRTPNGYPSMVNNGVAYTMINGKKVKVIPIKKL